MVHTARDDAGRDRGDPSPGVTVLVPEVDREDRPLPDLVSEPLVLRSVSGEPGVAWDRRGERCGSVRAPQEGEPVSIHPRVTVNPMTTITMPLAAAAALWVELGTVRVGLNAGQMDRTGWAEGIEIVRRHGIDVVYLNYGPAAAVDDPAGWRHDAQVLTRAIDAAALFGADCVYFCTGSPGACLFEEAAEHLAARLAPVLEHAGERGVRLALEPCVSSRPELGFVHTVRDAAVLAERLGMGLCVDFYASWMEPQLGSQLAALRDQIDLVQISDFVIGTLDQPNRWVPGDGDLPLDSLLDALAASGYEGAIDLELLGPRITEEGAASALRRGTAWLSAALDARGM